MSVRSVPPPHAILSKGCRTGHPSCNNDGHGPATCVPSTPVPSLALPSWLVEDHPNSAVKGKRSRKRFILTALSLSLRLWSYFLPMLVKSLQQSVVLFMLCSDQNLTEQCGTKANITRSGERQDMFAEILKHSEVDCLTQTLSEW